MPSPTPTRLFGGVNAEPKFSPLAEMGMLNPLAYHLFYDDFDYSTGVTGIYTATKTGNGTIAQAAGNGGTALFTTNSSTAAGTDICSLQLPAAGFKFTAGKKAFFLTRLKVASAANAEILVGLIQTTTTPFTVTDGLYFLKPTGAATGLVFKGGASSTLSSVTIPTNAYTLADATYIDLGWYVDRNQQAFAYVGSQLIGYMPNSGTGSVNSAGVSALPVVGPVSTMGVTASQAIYPTGTTWSVPSADLNVTVALKSGAAASTTMTVDFVLAAMER